MLTHSQHLHILLCTLLTCTFSYILLHAHSCDIFFPVSHFLNISESHFHSSMLKFSYTQLLFTHAFALVLNTFIACSHLHIIHICVFIATLLIQSHTYTAATFMLSPTTGFCLIWNAAAILLYLPWSAHYNNNG